MKNCLCYWLFLELFQHLLIPGMLFFNLYLLHLSLHFLLLQFFLPDIFLLFSPDKDILHDVFFKNLVLPSFLGLGIDGNHDNDALLRGEAHLYKFLSLHEGDCFPLIEAAFNEEFDAVGGKMIAEFIDQLLHGFGSLHLNFYYRSRYFINKEGSFWLEILLEFLEGTGSLEGL